MRTIKFILLYNTDEFEIYINDNGSISGDIDTFKKGLIQKYPTPARINQAIEEFKNPPTTHFYKTQSKKFFNTVAQTLTTIRNEIYG